MFLSNSSCTQVIDYLKSSAKGISSASKDIKLEKIDSVLKLIYQLFLYSIVGVFAKVLTKFFK